jgi:hypothetical protein
MERLARLEGIVMNRKFPIVGQANPAVMYRTEPALTAGAEIPETRSLLVGQNSRNGDPEAAMLLGSICERNNAKSFLNWGVWLDATFPHVILIVGKRGSGKSYDLGIIAEGLCAIEDSPIAYGTEPFAMILFDTQSQFWTLSGLDAEDDTNQKELIRRWNIGGNRIKAPVIYRPKGTPQIGEREVEFALRPSDLEAADWAALCGLERFSHMGQCLYKARDAMGSNFSLEDLIAWLKSLKASAEYGENTRDAVRWRLEAQASTKLFDPAADEIGGRLGLRGSKSVIQLAELDEDTKAVIVAVIMRKVMNWAGPAQRRKKMALMQGKQVTPEDAMVAPRVWVLIDEAHLICPSTRYTAARPVVVDFVKRGRDAGLSLVLATQQPSAIDTAAISQSDIVVMHKLTIDSDIAAASARMPARGPTSILRGHHGANLAGMDDIARALDSGQSMFADTESSRAFLLQSRPRVTPHGGGEPAL